MATDDTQPVKNRETIAEKLAAVLIITWDRFIVQHRDGQQLVDVYSWIDREDKYKDFVWVRFHEDGAMEYTTSSEEYTKYRSSGLDGWHDGGIVYPVFLAFFEIYFTLL